MKYVTKRQFLISFGFLLIVACTLTKVYGQTIEVVSQNTFSTVSPPKEVSIKLMEPLVISENDVYAAGTIMTGNLTDVISPKRLKRDAGFKFEPTGYYNQNGDLLTIKSENLKASYTVPIDKGTLAKNITLGIGNCFVKGLSMGVAAVSGAIKNEEDNRLKSSATALYEASPMSYIRKGEDLYIQKDEHFFLNFYSTESEISGKTDNQNNVTK